MKVLSKFAAALALGVASIGLAGCATGMRAEVSRFNAMPAPAGQSFFVVAADPADQGGLEFARYAAMVSDAMRRQGYAQAPSPQAATMLVKVDYGVDEGSEEVIENPMPRSAFHDPFWGWYGRPYYSRYGYYGPYGGYARSPFYYGWYDPFFDDGYGYGPTRRYTVYESFLDVDIHRRGDNAALFEGRAEARSRDDELIKLVPNLVEAMFTNFPGRNGETVKITVPPARKG